MGLWLALILCIALSAFFSATETAFSACNRVKLKTVEGPRKERAQIALSLLEKYDSLITTVLIGNNLVNIVATAIATLLFTTRILPGKEELATTIASIVMTVVVLFVGEVGPKTLAKQQPEKFAMAVAPVIRVLMVLLKPLDLLFSLWRKLLSKLVKPEPEENQIEEELMTIIDEAQTEGDIEEDEGKLIRSAIEFNDQNASDIMTPRVDVTAIEDTATIEQAADLFRDTWFSRIPVYHEDLDHVVGILNEKDFYKMTHEGCTEITKIMKEPVFAPASLPISNLLKLFRTSKTHLVILLDEFGGTDGIVTMEDVLEELVGEIYDEHDEVSEEVVEQEDGSLIVDGNMQLEELMEKFGLENTYNADTVGGWAGEMLEKVPEVGNSFSLKDYQFTVMEMDGFRVTRMQVAKLPPEEPEEAAGEEKPETEPETAPPPSQGDGSSG
ncbi:MAG: hemolysin family protein [Clostridia bacterium]